MKNVNDIVTNKKVLLFVGPASEIETEMKKVLNAEIVKFDKEEIGIGTGAKDPRSQLYDIMEKHGIPLDVLSQKDGMNHILDKGINLVHFMANVDLMEPSVLAKKLGDSDDADVASKLMLLGILVPKLIEQFLLASNEGLKMSEEYRPEVPFAAFVMHANEESDYVKGLTESLIKDGVDVQIIRSEAASGCPIENDPRINASWVHGLYN